MIIEQVTCHSASSWSHPWCLKQWTISTGSKNWFSNKSEFFKKGSHCHLQLWSFGHRRVVPMSFCCCHFHLASSSFWLVENLSSFKALCSPCGNSVTASHGNLRVLALSREVVNWPLSWPWTKNRWKTLCIFQWFLLRDLSGKFWTVWSLDFSRS